MLSQRLGVLVVIGAVLHEVAHSHGKPCILHSCGYFNDILEDVIEDMRYDGRHSYEDNIMPVEEAYELMNGRIAVLGGIDMNFLVSGTPEAIYDRARAMLERTADRAGYMLGSGNSIPEYVPHENYLALFQRSSRYCSGVQPYSRRKLLMKLPEEDKPDFSAISSTRRSLNSSICAAFKSRYRVRYWCGVLPVSFLNARMRCSVETKSDCASASSVTGSRKCFFI